MNSGSSDFWTSRRCLSFSWGGRAASLVRFMVGPKRMEEVIHEERGCPERKGGAMIDAGKEWVG